MHLLSETFEAQSLLADYCRTGIRPEITGTNKNITRYRELVYNVVFDTLENAYPIAFQFIGEEKWHELVHDFFSNHKAQTPQVWKTHAAVRCLRLCTRAAKRLATAPNSPCPARWTR